MNTKPFLSGIALVALVWASAPASADFGPIGVDCRELAMGGAAAADARGPSAVYWNPAGLRRDSGLRGVLGFGMMQHPDFGESEYGVTDRPFLGVSWAPEDEKGPLSLGAALERPFPRFGYDGRGVVAAGSPAQPASLDMTSSQDYLEILAGVGVRVLGTKVSDLELTIDAGMSLGLGFSSNEVYASLDDLATLASAEQHHATGSSTYLPGGLGVALSLEGRMARAVLGLRYRGVLALRDESWITFRNLPYEMTEGDLFMPPPQEGAIGLAVTFFERLTYSFEVAVLMFDAPDEFPNLVPHNYTVVKFGVEYRLPFRKTGRELAMRFGVSRSFMDPGNDETIFTTESTGVYFGWGVQVDPLARFDAYFTVQIPGEGDVDDDLFLASVSYGMTF